MGKARKPRVEPRFVPAKTALIKPGHAFDEDVRGMFNDREKPVFRTTSASRPETIHYGQKRPRLYFEDVLGEAEMERIMPSWEKRFLPDWQQRTAVRAQAAIQAHNARARREGGPIFNAETSEEIFPEELAAAERHQAQVDRFEMEQGAWGLLAIGPWVLAFFFLVVVGFAWAFACDLFGNGTACGANVFDGITRIAGFFFLAGFPCFVIGLIGIFATKYKYRHLDPTAGDPVRQALKGAAVNVAGGVALAYAERKLGELGRPRP